MERKTSRTVRNILIAAAFGIVVGLVLGVLNSYVWPGKIPAAALGGGVGATIGVTYVLLNSRKAV